MIRPHGVIAAEEQRAEQRMQRLRDRIARLLNDAMPAPTFSEYDTRKAADWARAVRHAIQRQQEEGR